MPTRSSGSVKVYADPTHADAFALANRTLELPRVEPHVYSEAEAAELRPLLDLIACAGLYLGFFAALKDGLASGPSVASASPLLQPGTGHAPYRAENRRTIVSARFSERYSSVRQVAAVRQNRRLVGPNQPHDRHVPPPVQPSVLHSTSVTSEATGEWRPHPVSLYPASTRRAVGFNHFAGWMVMAIGLRALLRAHRAGHARRQARLAAPGPLALLARRQAADPADRKTRRLPLDNME